MCPFSAESEQPVQQALKIDRQAWRSEGIHSASTTREAQMDKIFGYLKGLHATYVMTFGTELGLFAKLAATPGGLMVGELASQTKLYPVYVQFWCDTACALELLDYDPGSGYRLAPFMDEILGETRSPYYLGAFPGEHLLLARDYTRYAHLFSTGGTYRYQQHDEIFLHSVANATKSLPRMFLDAALPKWPELQASFEDAARMLDVGCGGGQALVDFAERYSSLSCVGIDIEPVSIQMAQNLIASRKLSHRVTVQLITGGSWPEEFHGSFDIITAFLVLHEIQPDQKSSVLQECIKALRPGGMLFLFDECYPSTPQDLRDPLQIYAVMAQWYEMTWGNIINTKEEIHHLLRQQDLVIRDEMSLSRFYLVFAQKAMDEATVEQRRA